MIFLPLVPVTEKVNVCVPCGSHSVFCLLDPFHHQLQQNHLCKVSQGNLSFFIPSLCLLPVNQPGLKYIDFKGGLQGRKER